MKTFRFGAVPGGLTLAVLFAAGCGGGLAPNKEAGTSSAGPADKEQPTAASKLEKKIEAARAKLSPEDRALVEAQDYCPVMPKQRLGSMGVPYKVMIKGQPVFLCCESCKGTAEDEPDEALKAAADLKARKK